MSPALKAARQAALALITLVIVAVTAASFAESYRGLYLWSAGHGLHGRWAICWPLQLDAFIAVGELALFVGLADRWRRRDRISAWVVTGLGLAASVAANVGHVTGHDLATRLTAAVPPLAAAASLAVDSGVLKRVVGGAAYPAAAGPVSEAAAEVITDSAGPGSRHADELAAGEPAALAAGPSSGAESVPPHARQTRRRRRRTVQRIPAAEREAAVLAVLEKEPGISHAELARRMECDEATIRRTRKNLVPVTQHD